ncbi:Na+/H+ antiporter subunit E [Streptomyces sp. DSM 42041]|uniref:Na+/H+ antiporter subunit E n=1 Tax=Streptomyces hazeniae TaxID=3075538 RepID=A0ABU2NMS8_9ACTN|nr:Na+/H+ antiporter subunit E [Streptomyces sp. DSM 42041]MDT0378282.1 Na+/H+ antiporter subunit E [Streptomyces sp. DSM 42041]
MKKVVRRLPSLVWLWLLWLLLWGEVSTLTVLGGLVASAAVLAAFPLPRDRPYAALRPLRLVRLLAYVVVEVFASAATVAWAALRRGPATRAAVLEVRLHSDTDFLITATAVLTTLTPGDLVVEIDRERRLLYVHTLPVRDRTAAERRRAGVRDAEHRVIHTLAPRGAEPRPGGTSAHPDRPGSGPEEDPP